MGRGSAGFNLEVITKHPTVEFRVEWLLGVVNRRQALRGDAWWKARGAKSDRSMQKRHGCEIDSGAPGTLRQPASDITVHFLDPS